jgi:hypothetical protein
MLLVALSAVLGAYIGLTRQGKVSAMLVSGVFAVTANVILFMMADLVSGSGGAGLLSAVFALLGQGEHMLTSVLGAFTGAAVFGLFRGEKAGPSGGLYLPDDSVGRRKRGRRRRVQTQSLSDGPSRTFGELLKR